jgi:hypothetical protein
MRKIALIAATAFAAGVTVAATVMAWPMSQTRYELQVTDYAGNLYVAGSGDDCAAAFEGAKFPAQWREINCVRAH